MKNRRPRGSDFKGTIPLPRNFYGCGDHGCRFVKPTGQGTNGGCTCLNRIPDPIFRDVIKRTLANNENLIRFLEHGEPVIRAMEKRGGK
jgi:hypothetical protein